MWENVKEKRYDPCYKVYCAKSQTILHGIKQQICYVKASIGQELRGHREISCFSTKAAGKAQVAGSNSHTWRLKLHGGIFTEMLDTWVKMIPRIGAIGNVDQSTWIGSIPWLGISRPCVPRNNHLWKSIWKMAIPRESNKAAWPFLTYLQKFRSFTST